MSIKLRRDDLVEVINGNDRGKQGRILQVDVKGRKVLVEGVNYKTHHERVRRSKAGQEGGIEQREAPIDISNVAIVDPKTQSPARVGYQFQDDGRKVRITKGKNASGTVLDN